MENLNTYKKIGIIVVIVILIAVIALGAFLLKKKNVKNYTVETTSSEIEDVQNINQKENVSNTEEILEEGNVEENPEDTSWDEEDVEDTKVDIEKEKKEQNSGTKYYIKINYTANVITVYEKDADGKYTKPVKAILCSTGTATPRSGVYKTSSKYRWHQLNGGVWGQYCTRITGHILFHSVPYSSKTPDSLKYVAYDKLGTKASAGCIRVTVADAIWLYNNCASGTQVEFYGSSDPGPLGKPSAKKISSNVQCRNWDPTDPDSNNPWHTYVEPKQEEKIEENKPQMQEQSNTNQNNTPNNDEKTTEIKNEENSVNNDVKTDSSDNKIQDNTSNTVENTNNTKANNTANTNNTKVNNTTNTNSESNTNTNTKANVDEKDNTASNTNTQKNTEQEEIKDKKCNTEANATIGNTNV